MSSLPIGDILRLSPMERLSLVEAIWDSLADDPSSVPVPKSHLRELEHRVAAYESSPGAATVPWKDVKQQVRRKLGR